MQSLDIASSASKTASFEHAVFQTMTAGEKIAGNDYFCSHWNWKNQASDHIKLHLPDLAEKTKFFWVGWLPSSLWVYEGIQPTEIPGTYGSYVWLPPCAPDTIMRIAGDVDHDVGGYVRAILANPSVNLWKGALVCIDSMPYADIPKAWNATTGKRATYISLTIEAATSVFGPFGEEFGRQFRVNSAERD
jgi:hypothetical protein